MKRIKANLVQRTFNKLEVYIMPLLALLLVAYLAFGAINLNVSGVTNTGSYRATASLGYCSETNDAQCQAGVMKLDYEATGRNDNLSSLYGYEKVNQFEVKIDEVRVKLNDKADELAKSEFCLYADSNSSNEYEEIDEKLACGFTSKRSLVFEGINARLRSAKTSFRQVAKTNFFIVPEEPQEYSKLELIHNLGEPYSLPFVDELTVKSYDLVGDSERIKTLVSVYDKSLFRLIDKQSLSRDQFILENPSFQERGDIDIVISGDIEISETTIVPVGYRLIVDPGASISLGESANFISYSPALFNGTRLQPITIKQLNEGQPFGVFSVLGNSGWEDEIIVNYVNVSGGSEAEINGAYMSGQFNLYSVGKAIVSNSTFENANADDGLNIKNSDIEMLGNTFKNNKADAFDGDFVIGSISANNFSNNGNDSFDFSGSNVVLTGNLVDGSGDKCISVGEGTTLEARNNLLANCLIGVQAKDSSVVDINNNVIEGSQEVALDAYVKKSFFSEPSVDFYNNYLVDNAESYSGLVKPSNFRNNTLLSELEYRNLNFDWLNEILIRKSNAGS